MSLAPLSRFLVVTRDCRHSHGLFQTSTKGYYDDAALAPLITKTRQRMTISRQQLQLINRRQLRYPLDVAEKDYHLALGTAAVGRVKSARCAGFQGWHCTAPLLSAAESLFRGSRLHSCSARNNQQRR